MTEGRTSTGDLSDALNLMPVFRERGYVRFCQAVLDRLRIALANDTGNKDDAHRVQYFPISWTFGIASDVLEDEWRQLPIGQTMLPPFQLILPQPNYHPREGEDVFLLHTEIRGLIEVLPNYWVYLPAHWSTHAHVYRRYQIDVNGFRVVAFVTNVGDGLVQESIVLDHNVKKPTDPVAHFYTCDERGPAELIESLNVFEFVARLKEWKAAGDKPKVVRRFELLGWLQE
jgi:hypothetical protein